MDVYQVHAFTKQVHSGNPSGVCVSSAPLGDHDMARIAEDLGPSVTAFLVDVPGDTIALRWFTRAGAEVTSYCGHATFAAAHVMLHHRRPSAATMAFETISGTRTIHRAGSGISVRLPRWTAQAADYTPDIQAAIGAVPREFYRGDRDLLLVMENAEQLRAIRPDFAAMLGLGSIGVIVAAPAEAAPDVVYRFFCPGFHIGEDEDPATGSALSTLAPYWFDRARVSSFKAVQLSHRGGEFHCAADGDEIAVTSFCATFTEGRIAGQEAAGASFAHNPNSKRAKASF
jgi:PhzF family phenazine biosynthesis protein